MSGEVKHRITDEQVPGDSWVLKTTHPRILYDSLGESFSVDLGDGAWCEVFGKNRFSRAVQIADSDTIKRGDSMNTKTLTLEELEVGKKYHFSGDIFHKKIQKGFVGKLLRNPDDDPFRRGWDIELSPEDQERTGMSGQAFPARFVGEDVIIRDLEDKEDKDD